MADQDALELIKLRNNFYRDSYRRVLAVLLLMVVIVIGLLGLLGYMLTHPTKPEYFATTSDGRVIRLYALSEPVVSKAELLEWAAMAATEANTYDFTNYRKQLQDASQHFTPTGWQYFQEELKRSNNLELVIKKKLNVNAVPTGAPVILGQGLVNGVYKWRIELPLLLTYQSASEHIAQPVIVRILVSRVSTLETPKGIQIESFIMAETSTRAAAARQ